jgi:AraC-like DNA-binding protein
MDRNQQCAEPMPEKDWSRLWHHKGLNLSFLQAFHVEQAYPRHSHDYYVVAVVDAGCQSFLRAGTRHITPMDGLILLNPGEVHTGEPIDSQGYQYRAFYPTVEHVQLVARELGRDSKSLPMFTVPRADDRLMTARVRALLAALRDDQDSLTGETRFLFTLLELMRRFGDLKANPPRVGSEHEAVRKVCDYIHTHYAQPISLSQLAELVHFSRYYLLHTFRDAIGMPPHLYLESVRVRHAQRLLAEGRSLAQVAQQVGFGSQSHFTQRFKQIIGVPPGAYARQFRNH